MATKRERNNRRVMRHLRVRNKISGSSTRPRLAVFRSLKHVYAQIIDDTHGMTLASTSTLDQNIKAEKEGKSKTDISELVGTNMAKQAKKKGIKQVVFDRGGYKYHGRVKVLAEAARKGGLIF